MKVRPSSSPNCIVSNSELLFCIDELDFDPGFIERFNSKEILGDRVEFLHHIEKAVWPEAWLCDLSTPLWRFNLHYFEYLQSLSASYISSGNPKYLEKGRYLIQSWVEYCSDKKDSCAWDSYTISMRVVNWLSFVNRHKTVWSEEFLARVNDSVYSQYCYLCEHLETDILANHYLENLKAIVLLSVYFCDEKVRNEAYSLLTREIEEQLLPDGMHYERSPMYHKIVVEDLLRVAVALSPYGDTSNFRECLGLQRAIDCLYSFERGVCRTPLFNDSGDNVAKSRDCLLSCAKNRFGIVPSFIQFFSDAGFFVREWDVSGNCVKLIVNAGKPSPKYAMGHMHSDALSFELYVNGVPVIVNRGTFAYQDAKRLDYKSTGSHSTIMLSGDEQNECWGSFRVARYGKCITAKEDGDNIVLSFQTPLDSRITRVISPIDKGFKIFDKISYKHTTFPASARFYSPGECEIIPNGCKVSISGCSVLLSSNECSPVLEEASYSPEFGLEEKAFAMVFPIREHCGEYVCSEITIRVQD